MTNQNYLFYFINVIRLYSSIIYTLMYYIIIFHYVLLLLHILGYDYSCDVLQEPDSFLTLAMWNHTRPDFHQVS